MLYMTRELALRHPRFQTYIQKTRCGNLKAVRQATVPFVLAIFAVRCALGRVSLAHINIAPRGSTWRKMLFAKAAQLARVPVILHLHGSGYDEYFAACSSYRQQRIRRFFREADRVVVLGAHWERFTHDVLGVAAEKIAIVENGVPMPAGMASPGAALPLIVFMGAVGERKGMDVLLAALGQVAASGTGFYARIGGDGDIAHYRKIAANLNISDRVEFLGWVSEEAVDRELRDADMLVLPSRAENQPVAIIEAMARGLPAISTNVGAIPDTLQDGICGVIVEPGKIDPLARAIATLAQNPALRLRMGRAARARWQERYSIESVAERMAAHYDELLR